MADPLRSLIARERARQAIWPGLLLILAIVATSAFFWPVNYVTDGRVVEATVVRTSTYPAGEARGGDLPILTVRLPDGTIRQVTASWSTAGECLPGSKVPLVQRGTALQVTLRGCRKGPNPA